VLPTGKDAHPPKVKEFGSKLLIMADCVIIVSVLLAPSPSKSRKRGTPKSAEKAALQDTPVSTPLGKWLTCLVWKLFY